MLVYNVLYKHIRFLRENGRVSEVPRTYKNHNTNQYMNRKIIIPLFVLLLCSLRGFGQESRTEFCVGFRVNSTAIDSGFGKNAERLSELLSFLEQIKADSTVRITGVAFCGTASPEGGSQLNKRLAQGRLKALEKTVRGEIPIPDSIVTRNDEYILWDDLAAMVGESDMDNKEALLSIIREGTDAVGNSPATDSRIPALQKLDNGKSWRELNRRFFGRMRNACVVFITFRKEPEPEPAPEPEEVVTEPEQTAVDTAVVTETVAVADTVPAAPADEGWRRRLYVKTNGVGWAMGIGNVAVEADLAPHWSLCVPVYYSAWNYFRSTVKFRTLAVQPEIRYWFDGNNGGWFAGAHFGYAQYNFALAGEYRIQDHDGTSPALGGGVSAGYRMPVSRNKRWKMEFSLGAGVYSLHYDKFRNEENGLPVATVRKTFFGIDQASVSIVYTLDWKRKGGAR